MRHSFFKYLVIIGVSLTSCAKIVAPDGGPKDVEPPIMVFSNPPIAKTNFKGKSIELDFNEYIKTQGLESQLIITPPLTEKPEIKVGSKSIKISWEEDLLDNRTYLFQFGDGIKDLNEGNILANFSFVFSTGPILDTLNLEGSVRNMLSGEQAEKVKLLLYADEGYSDSLLTDSLPVYIAQTADGNFNFNYLKEGKYRLIALEDLNSDFKYQPDKESVAFLDTLISLPAAEPVQLNTFKAKPSLRKPLLVQVNQQVSALVYNQSIGLDSFKLSIQDSSERPTRWSVKRDSLYIFGDFSVGDSLPMLAQVGERIDTLKLKFRRMPAADLKVKTLDKPFFKTDKPINLQFNYPIIGLNPKKMRFEKDTLSLNIDTVSVYDEGLKAKLNLAFADEGLHKLSFFYQSIRVNDSTFADTIYLRYNLLPASSLGTFVLLASARSTEITGNDSLNYVYELLDKSKNVYASSTKPNWTIEQLPPGKYTLRKFHDRNGNGQWDTGDLFQKKQPEKMMYYPEPLDIRANWTQEIEGF